MGELAKLLARRTGGRIPVDKELLNTPFESKCVRLNESGRVYRSAQVAADDNGINYRRMKRHLDGEIPFLRGHQYPLMHFVYTDDVLDKNGKVITPTKPEVEDE